jgi:hypothetical protein
MARNTPQKAEGPLKRLPDARDWNRSTSGPTPDCDMIMTMMMTMYVYIFKNAVRTSKRTQRITITKINCFNIV